MALSGLLNELGSTIIEIAYGRVSREHEVSDVVLLDPFDPPQSLKGSIVLGAGVSGAAATIDLLEVLSDGGAVALVLRDPVGFDSEVADVAAATGIAVFSLSRGVGWVQVATRLTRTLAGEMTTPTAGARRSDMLPGRLDADYIFEIANATAHLLDSPVTVEDLNSRILAYSDDQGRADDARKSAVLSTQVPDHYVQMFRASGAFKSIYAGDAPVYLDQLGAGIMPRVVARLSAGNDVFGSLWAVVSERLSEEQSKAFVEAARLIALHLESARTGLDSEKQARRAVLAGLLAGGARATVTAREAGIPQGAYCVWSVDYSDPDHGGDHDVDPSRRSRIAQALGLHLAAVHPGSVAGTANGGVYGILHLRAEPAKASAYALQIAQTFADRMLKEDLIVAIGPIVRDPQDIARSAVEAERAMRLVRDSRTWRDRRVLRSEDVQTDMLLQDVKRQMIADDQHFLGPVPELIQSDRDNGTEFVRTLDVFLSSFGDIARAAAILNIHPNTCRYRLRRISETVALDLDDADARFDAMLQLRLHAI
jgi:hypothetical protein